VTGVILLLTVKQKEREMKRLTAWVDQQNQWNSLFKGQQYEFQTARGRQRIAEALDAALSPENLTCDGELTRSQVNAKYTQLTGAAKDLVKLDPNCAQYMYEFG
jgi:hypothetical protein